MRVTKLLWMIEILFFEWSPGHNIDDNKRLIVEEENKNIEDDTETIRDENDFHSQ